MSGKSVWVVGSDAGCDIVVQGPHVSRRHCELTQTPQGLRLVDLQSTNGTYVNGSRLSGPVMVTPADVVTLGTSTPLPWPKPPSRPAAPAPAPTMQQPSGPIVGRPIRIGSAPDNDLVLNFPMISGRHASFSLDGDRGLLEDVGSTNGTFVGSHENRVRRAIISPRDVIYLGSFRIPAQRLFTAAASDSEAAKDTLEFSGNEMVLGRDASCDHVLDFPMISRRHARLRRANGQILLEDLGSGNGTFVNGRKITAPVAITQTDVISLGSYQLQLTSDGRVQKRDYRGNLTIETRNLVLDVPGRRLLENVSLTIYPSEFVGLMGPSGAGKTTLMNAMNGYTPPTHGSVLFNGQDLYSDYAQFSGLLGYVPQDDIMHRELTVGQALYYTARMRLPQDMSDQEINDRIRKILKQLGLEATVNTLIGSPERKGISGGQRKRVNLAMELLTDPPVLFLDEPTSGLSSEDALMVMKLLRELADSGKSILLTIHQPSLEAYRLMDNLVIVSKDAHSADPGRLAYYGPAYPEAVHFFNPDGVPGAKPGIDPSPDEVLRGLAKRPTREWTARYEQSKYSREYVTDRAGKQIVGGTTEPLRRLAPVSTLQQWFTLVHRSLAIKISDRWNTVILLAQAPIVAFILVLVFGEEASKEVKIETWEGVVKATGVTVFLLSLSALWFGCSNAVREIVGEWAIYHRERMVNLRIPAYVISKLAVIGFLCVVQCAVMVALARWGCALKSPPFTMFLMMMLISATGIGLGLVLSAVAKTSEVAIALLPLTLIPMVILGGIMLPVHKMKAPIKAMAYLAPSRSGFESMILLEANQRDWGPSQFHERITKRGDKEDPSQPDMAEGYFPAKQRIGIAASIMALIAMFGTLVAAVHLILRFRDVHR